MTVTDPHLAAAVARATIALRSEHAEVEARQRFQIDALKREVTRQTLVATTLRERLDHRDEQHAALQRELDARRLLWAAVERSLTARGIADAVLGEVTAEVLATFGKAPKRPVEGAGANTTANTEPENGSATCADRRNRADQD